MVQPNLMWIDLETNGETKLMDCWVLELGLVVTDHKFASIFDYSSSFTVPVDVLTGMPETVIDMHTKNGLIVDCLKSNKSEKSADSYVRDLCQDVFSSSEMKFTLAGSGVSHYDQRLLQLHFPYIWSLLDGFVSWGKPSLDLGVVRRLLKVYGQEVAVEKTTHRALEDCYHHIDLAKKYKKMFGL